MNSKTIGLLAPTRASARAQQAVQKLADAADMIVWMTDADDVCIYLNESAKALFEEGEQIDISAWARLIHPDDLARVLPVFLHARDTRSEYKLEYRIVRSDGSTRWMMGSGAARFSEQGEFAGFNGTIVDVSDRHRAMDLLAKREAAYRLLTDHSSDVITHHAPGGGYIYASPSFTRVLGYDPEELTGMTIYDGVHAEDQHLIREELQRQLQGEAESRVVEFRIRHKNGHYLWMGAKAQVLRDPVTGEHAGTVAVSRDITTEREAKEELKRREERFRSLTSLSSDWYWETDEHGRRTFVSDGIRNVLGVEPSSVVGFALEDLNDDLTQSGMRAYQESMALQQPFRKLRVHGRVPGSDRTFYASISGEPVFEDGRFKGYRGVTSDVSDDIRKSERLAQLAAENRAVVEHSPDMIIVADATGVLLRVNSASMHVVGYPPEELVAADYSRFILPDDLEHTQRMLDECKATKLPIQDFENRWIRKDGRIVHLSWSLRWSQDNRFLYCIARDVTERCQAQQARQDAVERLNRVLESIGEGFFTVDRNWRATYINQIAADFLGHGREEFVGMRLWTALPDLLDSPTLGYYRRAMDNHEASTFESWCPQRQVWAEVRLYPHADGLSIFLRDVTQKREAEKAVWLSEQRLREVVEMTPAGYVLTDANCALVDVNPALCELTGYSEKELLGKKISKLFSDDPFAEIRESHRETELQGIEGTLRHRLGYPVHALMNAHIRRDGKGDLLSITAFLSDITARKHSEMQARRMATHDLLTDLPNRAYLDQCLPEILGYGAREQVNAVLYIDLDGFKQVNDTRGHAAGDTLLVEIARRMKRHIRHGDILARVGGDEFVVVAPCADGTASASAIAENLLTAISAPVRIGDEDVLVGASIGICLSPADGTTREALFERADAAMYRVKASGKNGYAFYVHDSESSSEPA